MKIGEYDIQWGCDPSHIPCGVRMDLKVGEQNRAEGQFFYVCPKCGHILNKRREDFLSEPHKKELSAERSRYDFEMLGKRQEYLKLHPESVDSSTETGNYWSGYSDD